MSFLNQNIWIIGASSGIGLSLAENLSKQGANLILSARNFDTLNRLNQSLGGKHHIYPMDISNPQNVTDTVCAIMQNIKIIHRVIIMAGIYHPNKIENMNPDTAKNIMDINFMGSVYVTHAILPIFKQQNFGQIVFCGSVAGYIGLPNGQPYSASKAALINFVQSLRAETSNNIDVKIINSGFVRTPMTDKNKFSMPNCLEPQQAAEHIITGLQNKSFEIHFPKRFTVILKILSILPYKILFYILKFLNKK